MTADPKDLARELRRRFVEGTLPLWFERGWEESVAGWVERLGPDAEILPTDYRRVMVHARMLYVFAYWGRHLGESVYLDRAARMVASLESRFGDPVDGGWFARLDPAGRPLDTDKDLYAHAFVLFGLAHFAGVTGERGAAEDAHRAARWIVDNFVEKLGVYGDGFDRSLRIRRPGYRQNPHMHLLEAMLALAEAAADVTATRTVSALIDLLRGRFLDPGHHVVEYLADDLRPDPVHGHRVEPGHHVEWSWLLARHAEISGDDAVLDLSATLFERALTIGEDPEHGGLFDEVDRTDGAILVDTKRIWPVAEWVKAAAVRRRRGAAGDDVLIRPLRLLLDHYLHADGRWTERLSRDLAPADTTMPASTVYHLSMAVAELDRL